MTDVLGRFLLACAILMPTLLLLGQVFLRVTGVPSGYPPLTALPLLSGAVGGSLISAVGYLILSALIRDQKTLLTVLVVLAVLLLIASFNLPWRLSYTRSLRFVGVTPSAQIAQALLHCLVVGTNLVVLLRR
ncbi:hypothetical protein [Deinococcus sp.]|uniref:hypothetical protein n=1 Tax=Deinococcus sp. TaxID=47478 RepID=UPI003CC51B8A